MIAKTPTIWIARCDHWGDLITTLPTAWQLQVRYAIHWVVQPYLQPFVKAWLPGMKVFSVEDFLTLAHFDSSDIFLGYKAPVSVWKHVKKHFPGVRLARWLPLKFWYYANHLSWISRYNNTRAEAELLRRFASAAIQSLQPLTPEDQSQAWLLRFNPSIELRPPAHQPTIICHPGSNQNGREWPAPLWARLIETLHAQGVHVVVTGRSAEAQRFWPALEKVAHCFENAIDADADLSALTQRITQASALIASGTGPVHVAAALGLPTVGLFPPITYLGAQRWRPMGPRVITLTSSNYPAGRFCAQSKRCNSSSCACMQDIEPQEVLRALRQLDVLR